MCPLVVHRLVSCLKESLPRNKRTKTIRTLLVPGVFSLADRHLRLAESRRLVSHISRTTSRASKLQTFSNFVALVTLVVPLVKLYLAVLVHWGGYCPKTGIDAVECITE